MVDTTKLATNGWGYPVASTQPTATTKPAVAQTTGTNAWGQPVDAPQKQTTTTAGAGGGMETMQYPSQWGQAQGIYDRMAQQPYQSPAMWGQGQNWISQLWNQGGSPVDVSGMWNTLMPQAERAYRDQANAIGQQWGQMNPGVSAGTGKDTAMMDSWSRLLENMAGNVMQAGIGAQENAANRMYQLPGMAYQYGAGEAANQSDYWNRMAGAAGGLQGLGSQYANLPFQFASAVGGLGQGLNSMAVDPWTQMAAGMVGNPYMTATTYQPNALTNFLGVAANTPWADIFGGQQHVNSIYPSGGF